MNEHLPDELLPTAKDPVEPRPTICGVTGPVILLNPQRALGESERTREAVCNRPAGHHGDHSEIRAADFKRLASW